MTNDTCTEWLVRHRPSAKDIICLFGIVLLAAIVVFITVGFLGAYIGGLNLPLAVLIVYGAYRLITNFFLEYECIFTNGDLDVDKIINRARRERIITLKHTEIESVKVFDPEEVKRFSGTVINASANDKQSEDYAIVAQSAKKGRVLVIVTPNEKLLECIKKFSPKAFM